MGSTLAVLTLWSTLWLPIYPDGLSAPILLFFGLAAVIGFVALGQRRARLELALFSTWPIALCVAGLVGAFVSIDPGYFREAAEDVLPYPLFALGLLAGRATRKPHRVLRALVWVCAADAALSLWNLPFLAPGIRATYNYHRLTAGLPLLGVWMTAPSLIGASRMHRRLLRWVAVPVMLCALGLSLSRGMLLGLVAGLVVYGWITRPGRTLVFATGLGIATAIYLPVWLGLGHTFLRLDQVGTVGSRVDELRLAAEAFGDHPLWGSGLGATVELEGRARSYVHNAIAYHVWKFGLLGTALLLWPLWIQARALRRAPRQLRGPLYAAGIGMGLYLTTSAAYKTYYLVWILGVCAGVAMTLVARHLATLPRARHAHSDRRHTDPQRTRESRQSRRVGG